MRLVARPSVHVLVFALLAAIACSCGGPSTAKAIVTFQFLVANNPGLAANIDGTIIGTEVEATVPAGTNVTALVATFETTGDRIEVLDTEQVSGSTPNDFSTQQLYFVYAADGSQVPYTVTVRIGPSPAKEITTFAFLVPPNSSIVADAVGTITGNDIALTVPFGTNVTAMIATFTTTGESVTVAGTLQTSGTTLGDFRAPVVYTVTAEDGTTRAYTVTVTIAPAPGKEIIAFSFRAANNNGLPTDVIATINGTAIAATVPFGTNVTALRATFAHTGMSIDIAATPQISNVTPNDFTNPVMYTVTGADTTTTIYTVTVTIAESTTKEIIAYSFRAAFNAGLGSDVIATINGLAISATVPSSANISGLIASFSHNGQSIAVGAASQVSGVTPNDFTSPVTYVVTAGDLTTQSYVVTVTVN